MNAKSDIMSAYMESIVELLNEIRSEPREKLVQVAELLADHIAEDKLVYLYGPGGHSNMNATEVFFRAGGLMHISAILDEGTMISNGALRSMAVERTPGYGTLVIEDNRLGEGDILILANAYGINTACVDAALEARRRGLQRLPLPLSAMPKQPPRIILPAILRGRTCMSCATMFWTARSSRAMLHCILRGLNRRWARPQPSPTLSC